MAAFIMTIFSYDPMMSLSLSDKRRYHMEKFVRKKRVKSMP